MNCNEFAEHLRALKRLAPPDALELELEAHAASCSNCRELLERDGELTCRDVVDFLDDYLEGRLGRASRAEFDRHLTGCADCVDYLAAYERTARLGSALARAEGALPPDVPEDLIRAILDAGGLE